MGRGQYDWPLLTSELIWIVEKYRSRLQVPEKIKICPNICTIYALGCCIFSHSFHSCKIQLK